jgi:acyl transferase domain-containing protein
VTDDWLTDIELTPAPREPGPIEDATEQDLARLGELSRPGQLTLAAMARRLARHIDSYGDDESVSGLAKAMETLRTTMEKLTAKDAHDPNKLRELAAALGRPAGGRSAVPSPVRDAAPTGSPDSGS